jgi:hypothetical protein
MAFLTQRSAQNSFQRDCAVQSGRRHMAAFENPQSLRFVPMPPREKAGTAPRIAQDLAFVMPEAEPRVSTRRSVALCGRIWSRIS